MKRQRRSRDAAQLRKQIRRRRSDGPRCPRKIQKSGSQINAIYTRRDESVKNGSRISLLPPLHFSLFPPRRPLIDSDFFLSQVYVGLSELFCRLQDADKSARYAARAYDLSRSLQLGDLNSRHHRAALLQMAAALRKKGELGDAHDYCSVRFRNGKKRFLGPNTSRRTRSRIQIHRDPFVSLPYIF